MTALELEEVAPDLSIADLEKRWGISRNALKARAKALGVELIRQGPTLTVWPGDRIAEADRLHDHLKAGGAMASFPGVAAASTASTDSQPALTSHGRTAGSQLALTPDKADQLAALTAAMAAAIPAPPADPLRRARGLAEAADNALVLTSADLATLLGQGVTAWRDGHHAYGYRFHRHQQGRQVLWTVARAITADSQMAPLPSAAGDGHRKRTPGFLAACAPAIDTPVTVMSRLELPYW